MKLSDYFDRAVLAEKQLRVPVDWKPVAEQILEGAIQLEQKWNEEKKELQAKLDAFLNVAADAGKSNVQEITK